MGEIMKKSFLTKSFMLLTLAMVVGCSSEVADTNNQSAGNGKKGLDTFDSFGLSVGERMLTLLNVTADQRKLMETLGKSTAAKNQEIRIKIYESRKAVHKAIRENKDAATILSLFKESQRWRNELDINRFEALVKIRDSWTATQRAEFIKARFGTVSPTKPM